LSLYLFIALKIHLSIIKIIQKHRYTYLLYIRI